MKKIINLWCGALAFSSVLNLVHIVFACSVISVYIGLFIAAVPGILHIIKNPYEVSPLYWKNWKNDFVRTVLFFMLCIMFGFTLAIALRR